MSITWFQWALLVRACVASLSSCAVIDENIEVHIKRRIFKELRRVAEPSFRFMVRLSSRFQRNIILIAL